MPDYIRIVIRIGSKWNVPKTSSRKMEEGVDKQSSVWYNTEVLREISQEVVSGE